MDNLFNVLVSAATIVGTGLVGSLAVVLPSTFSTSHNTGIVFNRAAAAEIEARKVPAVKVWIDPGYEKGTHNTPAILAKFNPFLNATKAEIEAWEEIKIVEDEGQFEQFMYDLNSTEMVDELPVDMVERVEVQNPDHYHTLGLETVCVPRNTVRVNRMGMVRNNTLTLLAEIDQLGLDTSLHLPACKCHLCVPFFNNGPKVYDTIGNADHADSFFSYGMKDTDNPPDWDDRDTLADDWYDSQLYV